MLTLIALVAHGTEPTPEIPPDPNPGAGTLYVDAKLPAEVLVDGVKLAQLWYASAFVVEVSPGAHHLRVYTNGTPEDFRLEIEPDTETRVVVGRTGITLDTLDEVATADPDAPVPVEFRSVGGSAQIRFPNHRIPLSDGERVSVDLPPGDHPMSVRNRDGTVIWASGVLEVISGVGLVVQVAEGRLPELSGTGRFHAGGG